MATLLLVIQVHGQNIRVDLLLIQLEFQTHT